MLACVNGEIVSQPQSSADARANAETSPTQAMTVAEVRRSLAFIRKSWEEQQSDAKRRPFYLSDSVGPLRYDRCAPQSIEHFALNFVLAHHTRRLNAKPPTETRGAKQTQEQEEKIASQ